MFGQQAIKLINELDGSDEIPPFNQLAAREVIYEIDRLYKANMSDLVSASEDGQTEITRYPSVQFRHIALRRNKRCLLAYIYNRMIQLRNIKWEIGTILPPEIQANLVTPEREWFLAYTKSLSCYMKSIGENYGWNLNTHMTPPKSYYIEVRCLTDLGKLELDDGQTVVFKKGNCHLLPRSVCEPFIRQGVLEHITF